MIIGFEAKRLLTPLRKRDSVPKSNFLSVLNWLPKQLRITVPKQRPRPPIDKLDQARPIHDHNPIRRRLHPQPKQFVRRRQRQLRRHLRKRHRRPNLFLPIHLRYLNKTVCTFPKSATRPASGAIGILPAPIVSHHKSAIDAEAGHCDKIRA